MPIETTTKNLNWPSLQGTVLGGGAYPLERFASGDENTATFETRTGGERASRALVRLAQADEETSEQQLQVWQAIKKSGHPNLIPIWGTGRARINGRSLIYVVMEASDENLATVLEERALEPAEAGEILASLVGALGHLHSHGLVHGGLSPEQVMAVGETVKVSTSGVRRIGSSDGLDVHKPKYRAPESPEGNISPAADIWCLGATLLQALTQRGCSENCLEEAARLPAPFDAILTRCLQTEPMARGTLAHLLALYDGTARNGPVAGAAGAPAAKTMAAAAGSGRGTISFDWDVDEEADAKRETHQETQRENVRPVYLAPGPIVPEAEAFAAEAAMAAAAAAAPVADTPVAMKESAEKAVPVEAVPAGAVKTAEEETAVLPAAGVTDAAPAEEPPAERPLTEEARAEEPSATEMPVEEASPDAAAVPVISEERIEEEAALPTAAQEPMERAVAASTTVAPPEVTSHYLETPVEEMPVEPLLATTTVTPREERDSREVDEQDPVAAANARLLAWREAAAVAMRSQGEGNGANPASARPEEIRRAKRRAWVFVAVALVILMAVVWVLRPSRSANNRTAQRAAEKVAPLAGSSAEPKGERPLHGQTMTLPAAGQNGSAAASAVATAPKTGPTAKAEATTQNAGPASRGPVWRVILYTYNREADAKKRAATINRRHPDLNAEVFAPNGAGKSPFLVSIGGSTDRAAMAQVRRNAMRLGLPRDSYLQNYSR